MLRISGQRLHGLVQEAELPRRLADLEPIVGYLAYSQVETGVRVHLHIQTDQKRQLMLTPGRLDISADLLAQPDLLERAVLFAQFPNDTDFSAAVKSEFLFQEELPRPHSAPQGSANLVSSLQGLGAYCHSNRVIVAHLTYCDAHNEYGDSSITNQVITDQELGPTPWSLVDLFVHSLRTSYETLDVRGKERFLKNLIFLAEPDDASIGNLAKAKSLDQLDTHFKQLISNWLMPLLLNDQAVDLALSTLQSPSRARAIRYVVIDRSARDVFPIDSFSRGSAVKSSTPPTALTLVEYGIKKYVFPNDVGFAFDRNVLFEKQAVEQLVYVSCEIPEVENLTQFGPHVSRVMFVRQCNSEDVDWNQALTVGVEHYLAHHPEVEFMEFNISALRLAKKQQGPLRNPDRLANWQQWLKWQGVVADDEEPSALRPLAAIEGVRRFRIIH